MKGKTIGILAFIAIAAAGLLTYLYRMENYDAFYYARIRDEAPSMVTDGDLKYEYRIEGYDSQGHAKKLTFKTPDLLKEGETLKIEVRSAGVFRYDPIDPAQIPEKARQKLEI